MIFRIFRFTDYNFGFIVDNRLIDSKENHDKSKKLSYKKTSFGLSSVKDRIEILNQNASHEKASFELLDRRFEGKKGCVAVLLLPKVKADIQEDGF